MIGTVRHNIGDLSRVLPLYAQLSGKTDRETLEKQGGKLIREVYFQLRDIRPAKGSIRTELTARLAGGRGIKVRPSVREKVTAKWTDRLKAKQLKAEDQFWGESLGNLNWKFLLQQKMIQAEIGLRESGRGILSISSRYSSTLKGGEKSISRYGQLLSQFDINLSNRSKTAKLLWSGVSHQSKEVVGGLQRPRGKAAIQDAVANVYDDIMVYVRRKQKEIATRAVKAMLKGGYQPA